MSSEEHEDTHSSHRRTRHDSDDGEPHEEVTEEALRGTGDVDDPRPDESPARGRGDGGVQEAGEDSGVGADVLEDGDGVEGGLVVGLG